MLVLEWHKFCFRPCLSMDGQRRRLEIASSLPTRKGECVSMCAYLLINFNIAHFLKHVAFRLLGVERINQLSPEQAVFARKTDGGLPLNEIVNKYKPTMLLGMTAVGGLFTEKLIRDMAKHCDRPIIFPLSNPTTKAECSAEQAFEWTDGKCIFASGSPFDPVEMNDGRVFYPTQCNNMFVFPGIGLGATLAGSKTISDRMLYVAAEALANYVSEDELAQGKVFPNINTIRDVSKKVAIAVIEEAIRTGQASKIKDKHIADLDAFVARKMYDPVYVPLIEKRTIEI